MNISNDSHQFPFKSSKELQHKQSCQIRCSSIPLSVIMVFASSLKIGKFLKDDVALTIPTTQLSFSKRLKISEAGTSI